MILKWGTRRIRSRGAALMIGKLPRRSASGYVLERRSHRNRSGARPVDSKKVRAAWSIPACGGLIHVSAVVYRLVSCDVPVELHVEWRAQGRVSWLRVQDLLDLEQVIRAAARLILASRRASPGA